MSRLILASILSLIILTISSITTYAQEFSINTGSKSFENSKIRVQYGSPGSGFWGNGITTFLNKSVNEDYAFTIDTFGCSSATYDKTGPSSFTLNSQTANYIQTDVKFTNCVTIDKYETLPSGQPYLEMQYNTLTTLWWEDFLDNPQLPVVVAIYNSGKDITKTLYNQYLSQAENTCGEQFGDCFLTAAGLTLPASSYKNHFIFGVHSQSTGRGIGEILPENWNLHDGWKLWWSDRQVPNYESFPNINQTYTLPIKRWLFVYTGGRAGMETAARAILDSIPVATPSGAPAKPGDANSDSKVDGLDYIIWLNHYNQTISGVSNGNFNADGKVDGLDYIIWLNNYGK